jgi:hypothetical protein
MATSDDLQDKFYKNISDANKCGEKILKSGADYNKRYLEIVQDIMDSLEYYRDMLKDEFPTHATGEWH